MTARRVVVVGGGIAGSASALALARRGHDVVLLERSPRLGGLLMSFEVGGTPLECFYHHVFPHERHIQTLIGELGLGSGLQWFSSSVGVFTGGRVWPFTSPLDLLRFAPLPLRDRLHTGVGALRLGRVSDWEQLDSVTAAGTGTIMRPGILRGYAVEAGFHDVEILPIEHDFWRFYRLNG